MRAAVPEDKGQAVSVPATWRSQALLLVLSRSVSQGVPVSGLCILGKGELDEWSDAIVGGSWDWKVQTDSGG